MDLPDQYTGFFGKVPTQGDFVSRRLPVAFIGIWDTWLQESLQRSRTQLGAQWLDTYLTSPIWRFALDCGVCDGNSWAGVLMPSVDRVGRHFPLTIAAGANGSAALLDWLDSSNGWYEQMEALALSTLQEGFALDTFDAALRAIPAPAMLTAANPKPLDAAPHGTCIELNAVAQVGTLLPAIHKQIADNALCGHSLWWTNGSDAISPNVLICRHLPAQQAFAAMLDGQWQHWGWKHVHTGS